MALPLATAGHAAGSLGVAGAYNVFTFADDTQQYTDAEGQVAVGGNATFTGYGVGDKLDSSYNSKNTLIVGGNLKYNSGQVFYGSIATGGTVTITSVGTPNGTSHVGAIPIDFTATKAQLIKSSGDWGKLTANGQTVTQYGGVTLTGTSSTLNIFKVSGAVLSSANNLNITAPAGSTVLINVDGSADTLQNFGFSVNGVSRQNVLFNFVNATQLTIQGISVDGSIWLQTRR